MTKVLTVVGTRPEVIRLSRVMARLDETVDHVLVHTGQNYDHSLNQVFFDELDLRAPDHLLNVDTSTLGSFMGGTLIGMERVLKDQGPDAVLILGDTNSSIAALMAKRMHIPVYHMEAGNRCFDERVPEETNRRLVDHVADFNLVYTEHARRNLLAEGLHPTRIMLTGSPMYEVLDHYSRKIKNSDILARTGMTPEEYFLVSIHREENVDAPERLWSVLRCLEVLRQDWQLPILVTTHPRTRRRLAELPGWTVPDGVIFHEPLGFPDYVALQASARCVLSDSGTISEESAILAFAAVTLRESIERPEALDSGSIVMTGLNPRRVVTAVHEQLARGRARQVPTDYVVPDTAQRTVRFILSTLAQSPLWPSARSSAIHHG